MDGLHQGWPTQGPRAMKWPATAFGMARVMKKQKRKIDQGKEQYEILKIKKRDRGTYEY